MKLKHNKDLGSYGEHSVTDRTCQKWFVKFLGTIDTLAKEFFAVGLSGAWEDV